VKTVLIYSGGMDSTVLLYDLLAGGGHSSRPFRRLRANAPVEIEHARADRGVIGPRMGTSGPFPESRISWPDRV